ncbi:hypothetical protein sS8_2057 [Methylocaldum marinum]|uniref:Uncharacterized protein n=1 Tax=Methylocaldum marinum TaxID=1432792 RepID=A0A250KQS2_9GAMM|nr:hypothetical protein sS8_2057 [Methylocaldum marinum]
MRYIYAAHELDCSAKRGGTAINLDEFGGQRLYRLPIEASVGEVQRNPVLKELDPAGVKRA